MPSYKRLAVLSHGPVLLGELLSQHGQLGFYLGDGLSIVLKASPGQTEGGFGLFDLPVVCAYCARNCWSPATARLPVHVVFQS